MSVATLAPGAGVTVALGAEYAAAWIPEPIQHNPDAARHDPGEDKGVDHSVSVEIVEKLVHPPVSPALALHLQADHRINDLGDDLVGVSIEEHVGVGGAFVGAVTLANSLVHHGHAPCEWAMELH